MPGQTLQRSVLRVKARSGVVAVLLLFSLLLLAQLEVMRLPVRASSFDIREHLSTKVGLHTNLTAHGQPVQGCQTAPQQSYMRFEADYNDIQ